MQTDMKSLLVNAFSRIPNYVFIKDASLVYRMCNQNFAEFSGFKTCDAVEGKNDYDMPWNRTHAALYREEDLAIIKTGKSFELKEVAMKIGENEKVLLISKAPLLNDAQEVEGILGIYIDISEQKKLERELLIAKDKAEAASRSKSEFIANMSHDIRTPITGVLAMAQQLLSSVDKSKSALAQSNQLEILDNLMKTVTNNSQLLMNATNELLTLCNDILGVVQLESGKTRQAKETFHIPTLVQHTTNLLAPVAKDKNLKLTSTIEPEVPDYLTGERLYLNRILLNITSNALKFTNKGFVKICLALADTKNHNKNRNLGDIIKVKLTIEDSGVGIPKDKQEIIFEHFSRLTESYSGIYKGAGLGLYTVKNYVESMRGTISVESEIDQGSKFTVILPFKIADHTTTQALKSEKKIDIHDESQDLISTIRRTKIPEKIKPHQMDTSIKSQENTAKILIVEDSQLAAIGLKTQLKKHLCQVDIAENGQQAVLMAKQKTYDLIFMDMGLPDIGGIEVTKKIRSFQNEEKSKVPIVAITGHGDNPDRKQACLEAGIQNVLCKPAQPKVLASILNNFVFKKTDY